MHENHTDQLSLFPKWGGHNAKQDCKNTKAKSKARPHLKRSVVKTQSHTKQE